MKSVLITGASRGIGYATAQLFLKNSFRVFACARNIEPLKVLETRFPNTCIPIYLDLKEADTIESAFDIVQEVGAGLDFIIQNAGHLVNKPFLEVTYQDLITSYMVNVVGPYRLSQKHFPLLNQGSHTIFISSMGGFQGSVKFPGLTAYSSSKASAASLAECLQAEFAAYSHSFNCLCLGAVQTEMLQDAFPGYEAPLQPDDMASFVYHFATTAHQFIRGKTIPVSLSTP